MNTKITIRISDDLRDQLDVNAKFEEVSTSELARKILEEYCFVNDNEGILESRIEEEQEPEIDFEEKYNKLCFEIEELENIHFEKCDVLKEDIENLKQDNINLQELYDNLLNEKKDVVFSVEFLQLVCWIYIQRFGEGDHVTKEEYQKLKNTLIKLQLTEKVNKELKDSFNIVFANIIDVEGNWFVNHKQLNFAKGNYPKFNYSLLNRFIFKEDCGLKSKDEIS